LSHCVIIHAPTRVHNNGDVLLASLSSLILNGLGSLPVALIYTVVFALVFGETALFVGFILPGETAVLVAGALASQHHVNIWWLCAVVVVAAILGFVGGYVVGRVFGPRLLELSILERRRVTIQRSLDALERRGAVFVFIGRFTAFLRAVVPALAGLSEMPLQPFMVANVVSGILWGVGYSLLGYFAGAALAHVEKVASGVAAGILVLVVVVVVWRHFVKKRHEAIADVQWQQEEAADDDA
jgi:membrane-associated protein